MRNLIVVFVFACLILGCATAYKSSGLNGGYSETQLDKNVFEVSFRGTGYTGGEGASDFALLRCAELALENGYKYFILIDANSYTSNSTCTAPTTSQTTGSAHVYGNHAYGSATTTATGGHTYNVSKPKSSNTIVCFKEEPEEDFSYNAEFAYKSITQKYGIKQLST